MCAVNGGIYTFSSSLHRIASSTVLTVAVVDGRDFYTLQQDIKTRNFPGENRAKENELQELADRISELEVQLISQEDDDAAAGAARAESLEVRRGHDIRVLGCGRERTCAQQHCALPLSLCCCTSGGDAPIGEGWGVRAPLETVLLIVSTSVVESARERVNNLRLVSKRELRELADPYSVSTLKAGYSSTRERLKGPLRPRTVRLTWIVVRDPTKNSHGTLWCP